MVYYRKDNSKKRRGKVLVQLDGGISQGDSYIAPHIKQSAIKLAIETNVLDKVRLVFVKFMIVF